jgi:uncharacterized protein YaaW (UPF0174 family)
MNQEKVIRICKYCQVIQEKIQYGKYNAKDKRWRDVNGKLWVGSVCPTCHRERMKIYQQNRRAAAKSVKAG